MKKSYYNIKVRLAAVVLTLIITFSLACGCTQSQKINPTRSPVQTPTQTPAISKSDIDYSKKENWAYYAEGKDKEADLFLICPTVDMGKSGNYNMSMADEKTKGNFLGALNMERGIYEDSAIMYAPYYQQMTFPVYSLSAEEMQPYLEKAYNDVAAAFEYYFNNINNGRPLILAGFSQGSQLLLMLMEEYFDEKAYSDKLVAAYCIGWRVTQEDLDKFPHLEMAQGESDTGVIVSFNSEAEGVEESLVVPKGMKTIGINPLNWKIDSTPADSSLNLGACFTDYDANIKKEIPNLTGAYLDKDRGTLRVPDVLAADYSSSLFPDGVYHLYDYQFFFRNLQKNVAVRLENFIEKSII